MKNRKIPFGMRLRRGFTLIELLVVILIIAILAALIVPRILGRTADAKISAAKSDLSNLSEALQAFRLDCGRYPTSDEGLAALRTAPSGIPAGEYKGPYLSTDLPNDPWNNPYVYKNPGNNGTDSFIVESYGSDGQEGGTGDAADIIQSND